MEVLLNVRPLVGAYNLRTIPRYEYPFPANAAREHSSNIAVRGVSRELRNRSVHGLQRLKIVPRVGRMGVRWDLRKGVLKVGFVEGGP